MERQRATISRAAAVGTEAMDATVEMDIACRRAALPMCISHRERMENGEETAGMGEVRAL